MLRIALVEDNIYFRQGLEKIIAAMPEATLEASFRNAEAALADIGKINPDVFIVDINLGGLTGIEFIRQAKGILKTTEFLICTIHDDNPTIIDALKSGATGYLLKESTAEEMRAAITEIKGGGSPMSPYISRKVISLFNQSQPPAAGATDYRLSRREKEILDLLAQGLIYKEIAEKLFVAEGTIKKHFRNIYEKLQVQNKVEALNKYRGIR
ncbi:response regulator [Mucilaginibacter pedocola]|uniref:DNA-binding response regulator n=1 Tax=Mucilaginibacter pedocola TaxID=1792845 RepID=A0A1S9PMP5_9SPHI|nr:response regulator transcription factor [Mucilaginibacter pedocola]OOQ62216.1 hypothetical protein BC343_04010 [Mucilaginibacter pedocola]